MFQVGQAISQQIFYCRQSRRFRKNAVRRMNKTLAIRADWIWTGQGLPLRNGCITFVHDRISSVSSEVPKTAVDIGSYCILPGFINSHTHLEFSDLRTPVQAGQSFAEWILSVVQHRRANNLQRSTDEITPEIMGLIESGSHGVRLALDVIHPNSQESVRTRAVLEKSSWRDLRSNSLPLPATVPFAELMSTTQLREKQTWQAAIALKKNKNARCVEVALNVGGSRLKSGDQLEATLFGLSPHAPYTTTAKLIRCAVARTQRWNVPIMMHVAESLEEIRWIEKGDGPLEDLLEIVAGADVLSTGDRLPLPGYIHELCQSRLAFIIHGNYLDEASMAILEVNKNHSAVVYCPRTHAHFQHATYPLMELRRRGIPILLGTDSRASNPDLSILEEARTVRKLFKKLTSEEIFAMITTTPSDLLDCSRNLGYIREGNLGQLTAIKCHATRANFVLEDLLESIEQPKPLGCSSAADEIWQA